MATRKPRPGARGLVMPPGRKIPRSPSPRPSRPPPSEPQVEAPPAVSKAAGELTVIAARIRACEACARACPDRAFGTGFARSPVMLVKEQPSAEDLETTNAFSSDAEALTKAFEALDIPISWVYGSTAVRCGPASARTDEVTACSQHLLAELEAVGPRVIVAFGSRAVEGIRALNGRCGLLVPDDVVQGTAVQIRSDLSLLLTEPLPDGVSQKDSKRRLWRDLQSLKALVHQ